MGLHTGDGTLGGDDYVGIDVHRAARIAGAAHGGQILLSDSIRALAEHAFPEGASLRDLGQHRLKDIASERLHELVIEGLPSDFPAPRTLDARPNNLPVQLTSFVGRAGDRRGQTAARRHQAASLRPGRQREVTAGPSGRRGAAPGLQGRRLLRGLVIGDRPRPGSLGGARAASPAGDGASRLEAVKRHLRDKQLLLVAITSSRWRRRPMLEELLSAAPALKVMVTSRGPVASGRAGVSGSVAGHAQPRTPPDVHALGRFEAVRLFTERALAVQPGFRLTEENAPAVVGEIISPPRWPAAGHRAGRHPHQGPNAPGDAAAAPAAPLHPHRRCPYPPERQRTLRDAIAWSLRPARGGRTAAVRPTVSVRWGWTLESAEVVCDPADLGLDVLDGLASLVDKSPGPQDRARRRPAPVRHAGDHPRVRASSSGPAATSTAPAGATGTTSSILRWRPSPT